jgi:hypothetical protein
MKIFFNYQLTNYFYRESQLTQPSLDKQKKNVFKLKECLTCMRRKFLFQNLIGAVIFVSRF